jgi:response regulator of citrate/malate metabolism
MTTASSKQKIILIIEDSVAVATIIQDFLQKLGYQNIHICNSGRTGIDVFEELVKSGKKPIVLLDYSLSDMNADAVMVQIFALRPDTKVIIESAYEKSHDTIKSVLRYGAYQYIEKPIRFENLKNAMTILEEEDKLIENKLPQAQKQIGSLLNSTVQISLARIAEYCNMTKDEVLEHMKQLESKGKVIRLENIKEISCSMCSSVQIRQTFHCPACNSSNFKHCKLIEHFKCGNVSFEESYKSNICPKCHEEIKTIEIDYRTIENYVCNDCGKILAQSSYEYLCLRCNSKFKLDEAKWITSEGFRSPFLFKSGSKIRL